MSQNGYIELREAIRQARQSRTTIPKRGDAWGVDLAGAYQIQRELGEGRGRKGYKLGLISPAKQKQMGLSTPLYGPIYAEMIWDEQVSLGAFIQPRLEPEVAIVLRADIPKDSLPGVVAKAIGGYCIGVDVLDSVWENYKFSVAEVAADNTSGGGFILGEQLYPTMPTGKLRLYLNGELRTTGDIEVLGDPIAQLTWLAGQVGGLQAGQVVFLGSPAASIWAEAGTLEVVDENNQGIVIRLEE